MASLSAHVPILINLHSQYSENLNEIDVHLLVLSMLFNPTETFINVRTTKDVVRSSECTETLKTRSGITR